MKERGVKRPEPRRNPPEAPVPGERLDELLTRVKQGDVGAFQELYGLYAKKILNYVYRMTGSREEAEDLTQDTFVLAFRNVHSLNDNRKFQSWLFRIAQNNIYQKYRSRTPRLESIDQTVGDEVPEAQKIPSPTKGPEERILSKELHKVIQEVIDELPEKYKQVFVLSAIHKMSYQEIADIVGRSLASVKSDIHRARVEVRNKIKKYLGENYGMSSLF
ncbi:MAG: sigma-70 family RNA polymerase sigma factor [Acidobacteria bacterium]|nr:sigma-70 family RNA polymerase sigma factor [Acidobacteriota bacterium]